MAASITRNSDKFIVRLPDGMRDRIKAAADTNGRTMNAEVVARLESTFRTGQNFFHSDDDLEKQNEMFLMIKELHERSKTKKE